MDSPADEDLIRPIDFAADTINIQSQCPLFAKIPAELRERITQFALAEYEITDREYDHTTLYKRPELQAPRRIDTALLRTCKAIYCEAWFVPWANAEHCFYLTSSERSPGRVATVEETQRTLDMVYALRGEQETAHLRVYAQLWSLEPGHSLSEVLDMEHFCPLVVTITIRHTDWWFWESDITLRLRAEWVQRCIFPSSVREVRLEFESLERKKGQVDKVAAQAAQHWAFRRHAPDKEGELMLVADETEAPIVTRWTGSSTWHNERWIRDETRPDELDYYIAIVVFRPALDNKANTRCDCPDIKIEGSPLPETPHPYVYMGDLRRARVPAGASAEVVLDMIRKMHQDDSPDDSDGYASIDPDSDGNDGSRDADDSDGNDGSRDADDSDGSDDAEMTQDADLEDYDTTQAEDEEGDL